MYMHKFNRHLIEVHNYNLSAKSTHMGNLIKEPLIEQISKVKNNLSTWLATEHSYPPHPGFPGRGLETVDLSLQVRIALLQFLDLGTCSLEFLCDSLRLTLRIVLLTTECTDFVVELVYAVLESLTSALLFLQLHCDLLHFAITPTKQGQKCHLTKTSVTYIKVG